MTPNTRISVFIIRMLLSRNFCQKCARMNFRILSQKFRQIILLKNFSINWFDGKIFCLAVVYDRNRNFGRNFGQIGRNISAESFGQPSEIPKRQKTSIWRIFVTFLVLFGNFFHTFIFYYQKLKKNVIRFASDYIFD